MHLDCGFLELRWPRRRGAGLAHGAIHAECTTGVLTQQQVETASDPRTWARPATAFITASGLLFGSSQGTVDQRLKGFLLLGQIPWLGSSVHHYPAMESSVQRIEFAKLGAAVGVSSKWWRRRLPQLQAAGLVTRRGKYWFGRPAAIIGWIGADQAVVEASRTNEHERARVLVEGVAEETRDPDLLTAASILRTC